MGPYQPGKAPGAPVQHLSRQVQVAVTDALRTLDSAKAIDPAGQEEVDSLRSVIWSDLTGLEAEFGREEGPRAELLDRFFSHLLSNGDHIGQIETLAGALLGGGAPPSQPPPDSPVAGLFRLHGTLTTIRRQWQEAAPTGEGQPAAAAAPPARETASRPVGTSSRPEETSSRLEDTLFEEMGMRPRPKRKTSAEAAPRGRALVERPPMQPARLSGADRFWDNLGGHNASGRAPDVDTPRPRVIATFVAVFVILAAMGVGVIYLGLNGNAQDSIGIEPSVIPTFNLSVATTTPQPTPTLSSAAPQLQVTGNSINVPCPGKGTSGFVLRNAGGQRLSWSAKVNPVSGFPQPVSLNPPAGSLFGPANSGTDVVSVQVKANVGNVDGTISISTTISGPKGQAQITYHIHGC